MLKWYFETEQYFSSLGKGKFIITIFIKHKKNFKYTLRRLNRSDGFVSQPYADR